MPRIQVQNLTLNLGTKAIFKNFNHIWDGFGLCLLEGKNGAGKSTLLRSILDGHPSICVNATGISFLGHDLGLYGSLTVKENIDFFCNEFSKEGISDIEEALKKWGLWTRRDFPVSALSRGLKQRTAILRSFFTKANIIMLDEPVTGLDSEGKDLFFDQVKRLSNNNLILVVMHDDLEKLKFKQRIRIDGLYEIS